MFALQTLVVRYNFLFETTALVTILMGKRRAFSTKEDYTTFLFYAQYDFSISSSIQALGSPESRALYVNNLKKLDILGLMRTSENQVRPNELQNQSRTRSHTNWYMLLSNPVPFDIFCYINRGRLFIIHNCLLSWGNCKIGRDTLRKIL